MGIIDTAKDLAELIQKSDNIELLRKALALEREVHDADRKLRERDRRIEDLEEQLRDKRRLVFRENCYWDLDTNEGPFCSACHDSRNGTIPTQADRRQYSCPVCNEVVVTEEEQRRRDAMVRAHNESTGY